jgi:Tfp pilus assembly protein PilV
VSASSRLLFARGRDERGFGMIELLAAMTIMMVGVLAVFALFQSGIVQLRRASTITTAAALADAEMERFRAAKYETLGLDEADVTALVAAESPAVYSADEAYGGSAASTTLSGNVTASTTTLAVASAAAFPATAEFRVKVDSEVLLVTAGAGTASWTVTRGADGTIATTHTTGAAVTLVERAAVASCDGGGSPCTNLEPSKTSTGADGKSYRVDTYVNWTQSANQAGLDGRALKQITVVVRDAASPYREWARVTSIFDEATGL